MIDILFIVLFFGMPFGIIKIMYKIDLKVFTISIPSFLIISIFLFAYIGTFPLYFGWDQARFDIGVQDKILIFKVFIFSLLTMLGLLAGFAFSKYILKLKHIELVSNIKNLSQKEIIFIVGLMIFCIIVLILYLNKIQNIALFVLVTDSTKDLSIARSLMTNDFPGKYHWYNLAMNHLLTIVTFIFFSEYLVSKKRRILWLFLFSFCITSFVAIMATEKAPFGWLLIGLFLTYYLSKYKGKMSVKNIIILFIIVLIILVSFYMYLENFDIITTFKNVFSRAFAGSIQPAYHYLEFFPEYQEFLIGRSFPNPGGLLPFKPYNLSIEVMNWKYPEHLEWGIVGSMPTVFWGEAYANFNYYGVIIIPFLVGIVIWIISYLVSEIENTPIKIGLLVWLILHYKDLSITGFSGYIIDFYLIFVFMIFSIIIFITKKIKS